MTIPGDLRATAERRPTTTEMPKIKQEDNIYHIQMTLANPIPANGYIKL